MNQKLTLASQQPTNNLRPFFRLLLSQCRQNQLTAVTKNLKVSELLGLLTLILSPHKPNSETCSI